MIKDIMSKKVTTVTPNHLLREVVSLMDKKNYKEIPITEDNKIKGIISYFDILNIIRFRGDSKVSNFMKPIHNIKETDNEEEVLKLMLLSGLTGLPVINENKRISGFISDYDLLNYYKDKPIISKLLVSDANVKSVKPVNENSNISEVKNIMNFNKRDRLPVVNDDGKFVGTILLIDLLRTFYSDSPNKIGRNSKQNEISKIMNVSIKGLIREGTKTTIDSKLKDAITKMLDNKLHGLIVVNSNNEPIGVLDRCSVLKRIQSSLDEKTIILDISGEVPNNIAIELRRIISDQLKILPRQKKLIKEIKLFVKRFHDSNSEGKVEINMTIVRDGKDLIIKKEGFDILFTLVDCIETTNQLLKSEK